MRISTSGFLALGLLLQGCGTSSAPVERELIIAPAPVACAGAPPASCLSVSEPDGDKWIMRLDEIDGFDYEPGFTYQVMVKEPPVNAEMAVVPRLALVRVVSKQPVGDADTGPLGRDEWRLQSISASSDQGWPATGITARFHGAGGWADGFAGCDSYLAALTVDGDKISVSPPSVGQQLCAKAVQDRQRTYLEALVEAQSFSVTGDSLELKLPDGTTMRFRSSGS